MIQKWFDSYEGPKALGWDGREFICSIGFNVQRGGRVYGGEVLAHASTPEAAIRGAYDQLPPQSR